jgi:hypothetical protein
MSDDPTTIDLSTEGFTAVAYPGPAFRPVPSFTFDIPPGWVVDEFPDALCILGTPADSAEPWSNVFIKYSRVLPTTALEDVAIESWEDLKNAFPDAEVEEEHVIGFEQFAYVRESTLTLLDESVTRVDAYFFGPAVDNATVDLFHVIGTHPVQAGDERTLVYMKMLRSFHIA